MFEGQRIAVILPALNEANSIAGVIGAIPDWVDDVIVADNGSTDGTGECAVQAGARVVRLSRRGYGRACLLGIQAAGPADILVFLDADGAEEPQRMADLIAPLATDQADFTLGSRRLGQAEPGALNPVQRWGNGLACRLIRLRWGHAYTDLGPFRAIRSTALRRLPMRARTFGWTVEMQILALKAGLRVQELPVPYRRQQGRSKISGTLRGVLAAGSHILWVIIRESIRISRRRSGTTANDP